VITSLQSLKQLDALVKQASEALKGANADNAALREKLARLESEHRRVKEELREAKLALGRHDRIRARLAKLSEKLEKIA